MDLFIPGRQFRIEKRETALDHRAAKKQLETASSDRVNEESYPRLQRRDSQNCYVIIDFRWRRSIHLALAKRSENVEATSHQKIIVPIYSDSLANGAILRVPTKMAARRAPCSVHSRYIEEREREKKPIFIPRSNRPWKLSRLFLKWKLPGYGCWSWSFLRVERKSWRFISCMKWN